MYGNSDMYLVDVYLKEVLTWIQNIVKCMVNLNLKQSIFFTIKFKCVNIILFLNVDRLF